MARINALTEVNAKIKALGLYVELSRESESVIIRKAKKASDDDEELFSIDLDNTQELPNCCGVIELGALELADMNYGFSGKLPKKDLEILKLLIQHRFLTEKHIAQSTTKPMAIKGVKVCRPVIFCSNGRGDCIFVEQALNELTEDFVAVSKSVNPRGRSLITVYISKQ